MPMWSFDLWHKVSDIDKTCQTLVVCQFHCISREPCIKSARPCGLQLNRKKRPHTRRKADLNISQGLSAVLYSLDPEQNKLLEVLLSITIDFYLTKVNASQLDTQNLELKSSNKFNSLDIWHDSNHLEHKRKLALQILSFSYSI